MRNISFSLVPLILLALALFATPAHAAKPDAKQVQSLADGTDVSCRATVGALPGPASIYNIQSICTCAHNGTAEALKGLDLANPAVPTKADQDKIAHAGERAVWSCAQPAYARILARSTETDCLNKIGDVASTKGMSDAQKRTLCACIGNKFARASTLNKLADVGADKMQSFADSTLQQAYSACKVQREPIIIQGK